MSLTLYFTFLITIQIVWPELEVDKSTAVLMWVTGIFAGVDTGHSWMKP
jgi:hypothetical protein